MTTMGAESLFAIGGGIARGLVLAGTIQSWGATGTLKKGPYSDATVTTDQGTSAATDKAALSFGDLGLMLDWFPDPADGWHAGVTVGLGMATVINQADDSTLAGTSFAGGIFGGYDWAIAPAWSLGLSLHVDGSTSAKLKDQSDKDLDGYSLRSLSVALAGSILHF